MNTELNNKNGSVMEEEENNNDNTRRQEEEQEEENNNNNSESDHYDNEAEEAVDDDANGEPIADNGNNNNNNILEEENDSSPASFKSYKEYIVPNSNSKQIVLLTTEGEQGCELPSWTSEHTMSQVTSGAQGHDDAVQGELIEILAIGTKEQVPVQHECYFLASKQSPRRPSTPRDHPYSNISNSVNVTNNAPNNTAINTNNTTDNATNNITPNSTTNNAITSAAAPVQPPNNNNNKALVATPSQPKKEDTTNGQAQNKSESTSASVRQSSCPVTARCQGFGNNGNRGNTNNNATSSSTNNNSSAIGGKKGTQVNQTTRNFQSNQPVKVTSKFGLVRGRVECNAQNLQGRNLFAGSRSPSTQTRPGLHINTATNNTANNANKNVTNNATSVPARPSTNNNSRSNSSDIFETTARMFLQNRAKHVRNNAAAVRAAGSRARSSQHVHHVASPARSVAQRDGSKCCRRDN